METLLPLGLLLLAITLGSWWLGRRFWQQSLELELISPTRFRTLAELVLLATLLNLLLYCFTAVFFLPLGKGAAHGQLATPSEWQEAHLTHEFFLLLLSGVCGALILRMRRGRAAALSWLTGCVVVIAGCRGLLIYDKWVDEHQSLGLVQSGWLTNKSRNSQSLTTSWPRKVQWLLQNSARTSVGPLAAKWGLHAGDNGGFCRFLY